MRPPEALRKRRTTAWSSETTSDLLGAGVLYYLQDGLLRTLLGLLYVDVHGSSREPLVDLRERRYPEPSSAVGIGSSSVRAEAAAGVEAAEIVQAHPGDGAGAVRGAVHGRVVDDHYLAVAGQVHVELQPAGPRLHRQPEGLQGVLRSSRRGAAVCEVERPVFADGSRLSLTEHEHRQGERDARHGKEPLPSHPR